MTDLNTTVFNLLGKQVSFSISNGYLDFFEQGTVTNVVLNLTSEPQISINDGEFYSFSKLLDFKMV